MSKESQTKVVGLRSASPAEATESRPVESMARHAHALGALAYAVAELRLGAQEGVDEPERESAIDELLMLLQERAAWLGEVLARNGCHSSLAHGFEQG